MKDLIYKIDAFGEKIIGFIYNKNKFLDKLMITITLSGDLGIIWIIISFFLFSRKKYTNVAIMLLLAIVLASILGEGIIKHIVKRRRPFIKNKIAKLLIPHPGTYSFPSGHTASSFAAATVFIRTDMRLTYLIVVIAILISFSRLYLRVHYLSDVIGGIILGVFSGTIIVTMFS